MARPLLWRDLHRWVRASPPLPTLHPEEPDGGEEVSRTRGSEDRPPLPLHLEGEMARRVRRSRLA